ncbi:MAG: hypothetical protein LUG46_09085 [Erysipelotrichaceae bacterium]|nr:hypothetical protein [Erysipelotrichaceae bacterium]
MNNSTTTTYNQLGDHMKKITSTIIVLALCAFLYKPVIQVSDIQSLDKKVIVIDPGHRRA